MIESNAWQELVLEVIQAAKKRMTVRDFKKFCQLAPVEPAKSYYDRQRVADFLIETGVVEIDEGDLRLNRKIFRNHPNWLLAGLKQGYETSWNILSEIDSANKISGKIDQDILKEIGLAGELAVISQLHSKLPKIMLHKIQHISLIDDSAGFDIYSPSTQNSDVTVLLEVKTSSRPGKFFHFFISRNEVEVGSKNPNWRLVAVLKVLDDFKIIGYLTFDKFSQHLPQDIPPNASWESSRLMIPIELFVCELP